MSIETRTRSLQFEQEDPEKGGYAGMPGPERRLQIWPEAAVRIPHKTFESHRPMHSHWVRGRGSEVSPHMSEIARGRPLGNAREHAVPSAGFDQPIDRDQRRSGPDQYELDHLVDNGGQKSSERDINGHRRGRDQNASGGTEAASVTLTAVT